MEKEGLVRALHSVQQVKTVKTLVTDRHPSIQKWLREFKPEIKHFYDVWHVAKSECSEFKISEKIRL